MQKIEKCRVSELAQAQLPPIERIALTTESLIKFRSTRGEEREVLLFTEKLLRSRGWQVERWKIPGDSRWNIFARVPKGIPTIIFTTHLDVVPGAEEQFTPRRSKGMIVGRGACDAKGVVATQIEAADWLRRAGARDIGLLFVVDEETRSVGAVAAAPILKESSVRYIVNGEPCEGRMVEGQKGLIKAKVYVRGKSCHSAYPQWGADANHVMLRIAIAVREANFGSDPLLGEATVNIGKLHGGTAPNVISEQSEFDISVRTVSNSIAASARLRSIVENKALLVKGVSVELQILCCSEPLKLPTLPGFQRVTKAANSDATAFAKSGKVVLMYGPGSSMQAHTAWEYVRITELRKAYSGFRNIYKQLKNTM